MIIAHGRLVACDTPDNLSRSVAGTTTLQLSILDKEQKVEKLLSGHFKARGVVKRTVTEEEKQDSIWKGTIETNGNVDIRQELFYLLADEKCPILEMTQSKLSLEDVFLELTEDNIYSKSKKKEEQAE